MIKTAPSWCEKIIIACIKRSSLLFVVPVRWITGRVGDKIYFLFRKQIKIALTLVWGNFEHWAIWSLHEFSWTFTPQSGTNNATLSLRCVQILHLITGRVGTDILRTKLAGFGLSLLPRTSLQMSETKGLSSSSFSSFDQVTDFDITSFFFRQRQVVLLRIKSSESINSVLLFPKFNLKLLSQEHFLFFLE